MDQQPARQLLGRGSLLGSFILFPITIFYFSPVRIIMAAAQGKLAGSAVVFGWQFISALFFGRAFCGWLCPARGLEEVRVIAQPKPLQGKRGKMYNSQCILCGNCIDNCPGKAIRFYFGPPSRQGD